MCSFAVAWVLCQVSTCASHLRCICVSLICMGSADQLCIVIGLQPPVPLHDMRNGLLLNGRCFPGKRS